MNFKKLKPQLILHEGLRRQVYDDETGEILRPGMTIVGNPTIGVGRNLLGKGISVDEAHFLLENDLFEANLDLMDVFPDFLSYPETVRHVFIDMRLNLGPGGFRGFEKMIAAAKYRMWGEVISQMIDSVWYAKVKTRGANLVQMMEEVIRD